MASSATVFVEHSAAEDLCAICLDRPGGAVLRPCGHNHFCHVCAKRLFSCPLCRAPLLLENGQAMIASETPNAEQIELETQAVVASRTVISPTELEIVQGICFGVWLFIFIAGFVEALHELPLSCLAGDPVRGAGAPEWLSVEKDDAACSTCLDPSSDCQDHLSQYNRMCRCTQCQSGYYNIGIACFKYLENLPPMRTGAALGGTIYFVLILATQCFGIISEVMLITRMVRRKLMPRKELFILGMALLIELSRMFLVDIFVMQEYFGGRSYRVFREPVPYSTDGIMHELSPWEGSNSRLYVDDLSTHTADTRYYIAVHKHAWSDDKAVCSTFTTSSGLLNFDESGHSFPATHTRFKTLGWVIGGEFALYYFFATFINEVADNLFVIPTTTTGGWLCKAFSIALEVFQLGALCPAAVFSHKDCLYFTDPLGVPLKTMSVIAIVLGYFVWAYIFISLPLAIVSCALLGGIYMLAKTAAALAPVFEHFRFTRIAEILKRNQTTMEERLENMHVLVNQSKSNFIHGTMLLSFVPLLCAGTFLGTLVVVGQGSKAGAMQILTAVVMLSDVVFKVVATLFMELGDYMLHRRVRSRVAQGAHRSVNGEVVGSSVDGARSRRSSSSGNEVRGEVIGCAANSSLSRDKLGHSSINGVKHHGSEKASMSPSCADEKPVVVKACW